MKPKFKPYSPEEFNRAFDKMCDELEAEFGYSVRAKKTKAKGLNKPKTYHITFHRPKKD